MEKISINDKVVAFAHDGKVVVNNSAFDALTLKDKASFIASTTALGAVEFRENFSKFTDYIGLINRLKTGEDVTFELLFNGIDVTTEQQAAIKAYHAAIKPLIVAVEALIPLYPFVKVTHTIPSKKGSRYTRGEYYAQVSELKYLWDRIKNYWAGITKSAPKSIYTSVGGHGKNIYFYKDYLSVGCQTIYRDELEQVAVAEGWVYPTKQEIIDAKAKKASKAK